MKNFVVRTKKPAQYFRGKITFGYSPIDNRNVWFVLCESYAGGNRNDSPIVLINFKEASEASLVRRIKLFAKRGKYIFSTKQKDF
jgi:hypothetical protein